jgi:hypothetical protein
MVGRLVGDDCANAASSGKKLAAVAIAPALKEASESVDCDDDGRRDLGDLTAFMSQPPAK